MNIAQLIIMIFLFIIGMILLDIDDKLGKMNETEKKQGSTINSKPILRKHQGITQVDFSSSIQSRKNYDRYKNESGLYEPRTPSKGIKIKKQEE